MGFILIDFKKKAEHRELKYLGPTILQDMDRWVVSCKDQTPTEEECKAMEDEQIKKLMAKFDEEAGKLKRVADEVPTERAQIERLLNWKRGKLFLKFSDKVGALKQQAEETLKYCQTAYEEFRKEQIESYPVSEEHITKAIAEFLQVMNNYIEDTYPEGVKGLDGYDDELPSGLQSYSEFQAMVTSKEAELIEENKKAIPKAIDELKEESKGRFKNIINDAIQKTVDEIVIDLSDDTLPYLDESDMESLRTELIQIVKDYGTSRLDK